MSGVLNEFNLQRFTGEDGGVVGALIFFYLTNTTVLADIYSDEALTEPLANPVSVAAGELIPAVWLDTEITYRRRLVFTDGTVIDQDPYDPRTSSADVSFVASGTNAVPTTLLARGRTTVYASDYETLQDALNTGVGEVIVDVDVTVTQDITFLENQTLRGSNGSLIVSSSATITNGILYANGVGNVSVVDLKINASGFTGGCPGIKLVNSNNSKIDSVSLTRCNIRLESSDNTINRGVSVTRSLIDMDGYGSTAVYVSGVNGASLSVLTMYDGLEGVGIYNEARNISHVQVYSHDFSGDGFVIISGQQIDYTSCWGFNCRQSGFTTQRQTSGANSRIVSYTDCFAYANYYDGFDTRGANSTPWGVDTLFLFVNCHSWDNGRLGLGGVGFYVVNAEGATLLGCVGRLNKLQNFYIDTSSRVKMIGCRSVSGASEVSSGINKTGILVSNSPNSEINGCISGNEEGATQERGIVVNGVVTNCSVIGGNYINNTVSSHSLALGCAMFGAVFDKEAAGAVTLNEISFNGIKRGDSFGAPKTSYTLNWPIGSYLARTDGGGAELYTSAGPNDWYSIDRTAVP